MIDADNLVVQMCAEGMRLESEARPAEARDAFEKAWLLADSDYERCIAAHYFARHQRSPEATLEWNRRSLELADKVTADGDGALVDGFYPSLQLNVGYALEQVGEREAARAAYVEAQARVDELGTERFEDRYGAVVRDAIARGLTRTS